MNLPKSVKTRTNPELDEFVRVVSHDMRAPIRHIRDFYQLLIEGVEDQLSDEQRELHGYIVQAIVRANEQMDRLLTYSRLNRREYRLETFSVCETLKAAQDIVSSRFDREIFFENSCPEDLYAHSCEALLTGTLIEVIDNAARFNTDDRPTVGINVEIKDSWVYIKVEDNGIGIETRFINEVTKPFRRLQHADHFQGVGMGLTIARKSLHTIGGSLAIDSSDHTGTCVTLALPKSLLETQHPDLFSSDP